MDAILWKELPLVQDMAAGILSIRADLMGNNTVRLYGVKKEDVIKDVYPEGEVLAMRRG